MRTGVLLICFFFIGLFNASVFAAAPDDSTAVNKKRLRTVLIGTSAVYGASLIVLNDTWYKQQGKTSFHFFNDNSQWNKVDKAGHMYSAYQLNRIGKELFLWTNMSPKKSAIWGSVMSQAVMIPIEILDGFSAEYGFSWGDIGANLLGAGLFLSQDLTWGEQKVKMKFSYHQTEYPDIRPEVLGSTFSEKILKDYNGQTYWLSFDLNAIAGKNNRIPSWLNLAFGYGAEEMVYGEESQNRENGYYSFRQFYLGIDFDLSHIKTKSSFVKTLLFVADMIKLPAPTIEFTNKNTVNYYWLYF